MEKKKQNIIRNIKKKKEEKNDIFMYIKVHILYNLDNKEKGFFSLQTEYPKDVQ